MNRHLLTVFMIVLSVLLKEGDLTYTECRQVMRSSRGVITTPFFPNAYPTPISCQWVIEAPADKVIAVYFTQFYMREGLKATEYAYYSPSIKMGKTEFGTISADNEPTYLVSNKPVLVLDFAVREMANIHMRVREFLLDVFGFNITYEMIDRKDSIRKDACLYHHCSFTGNCYTAAEYDKYYCHCFAKYFGDECQFDQECGPTATRNMCQNGGTCRYYIGSTVRTCECPPGYDGARCETMRLSIKPPLSTPNPGKKQNSSSCDRTSSALIPVDLSKKCLPDEGRQRYIISLNVTHPKVNAVLSERRKLENFKKEMEKALELLIKPRLQITENITVLEFRADSIMKFHLIGLTSDMEELKTTIEEMLEVEKLGIFDFDPTYFNFENEPALRIIRIEVSEKMPIAEGTELTLACLIEGSKSILVEWFRNGFPMNVHASQRGMWMTVLPKNSQGQFTALLGFDRTTSLDSGIFTCQVSDWGFTKNKTIRLSVMSAPQPQLTPRTATIYQGDKVVITCLSEEDVLRKFGYTWLKNGQILNPSNEPEMIEDLFPAGSRILLLSAKSSATYTCIITSSAGSARKDSTITVLNRDKNVPSCLPEERKKVKWSLAASNTDDIQLCPGGYGYTGDVRRHCSLTNNHEAVWEEPDFSGCLSHQFLMLKKKVDSLRLGYLLSDISTLLQELKRYVLSKSVKLQISEGEPVVDLLQDIQEISHVDQRSAEVWQVFLDIVSALLGSANFIKKQSKIIELHEQIFLYGFKYAASRNNTGFEIFQRKAFAVEVGRLPKEHSSPHTFPSKRFARSTKYTSEFGESQWPTGSVEIDFSEWKFESPSDGGNSSGAVVIVFYRDLSAYVPERFVNRKRVSDVEYQLISSLIGIRVSHKKRVSSTLSSVKVKLTSFNHTVEKHIGWNISCAMVDFSQGKIQFSTSGCKMLWTTGNVTLCSCHLLGTYALLLTHYKLPDDPNSQYGYKAIAAAGCAIGAFFLILTFFLLCILWRKIKGTITALKIQVCVALLGAYGTFFCGLDKSLSEDFYPYTVTFLQFFLLTAFSLQLCIGLAVYVESVDIRDVHYSSVKIAAIGWAVPVIVLGATLVAQSLDGFALDGWWLTLGSNFFYAYTSSVLILTLFQILLFLTVKAEIRNHRKISDFVHRKKARVNINRVKLLHRSLLMTTTLLLVSVSSILYVNFNPPIFEYFFASSSAMLGLIVFLSYTFCSEKNFLHYCLHEVPEEDNEHQENAIRSRSNSFKSFLKPEIIDETYTTKLHVDVKRADRIKRMYSQIEKSSLSESQKEVSELLVDSDTPRVVMSEVSQQLAPLRENDGRGRDHYSFKDTAYSANPSYVDYSHMKWKYNNHEPLLYNQHIVDSEPYKEDCNTDDSFMAKTYSEDECDDQYSGQVNNFSSRNGFENAKFFKPCELSNTSLDYRPSSHSNSSFCETVQADIVSPVPSQHSAAHSALSQINHSGSNTHNNCENMDDSDDRCSLRNSCFMHHTDSLETVVYCDKIPGLVVPTPLSSVGLDKPFYSDVNKGDNDHSYITDKSAPWNITTV